MNVFFPMLFLVGCGERSGLSADTAICDNQNPVAAALYFVNLDCSELDASGMFLEGLSGSLWSVYGCNAAGRCAPVGAELMTSSDDPDEPRDTLWATCPEGISSLKIAYIRPH